MTDIVAEKIIRLHKIIDQALQAEMRGSVTVHYGGKNRVVTEFNLGLTDKEALDILVQRAEQKRLRVKNGD